MIAAIGYAYNFVKDNFFPTEHLIRVVRIKETALAAPKELRFVLATDTGKPPLLEVDYKSKSPLQAALSQAQEHYRQLTLAKTEYSKILKRNYSNVNKEDLANFSERSIKLKAKYRVAKLQMLYQETLDKAESIRLSVDTKKEVEDNATRWRRLLEIE